MNKNLLISNKCSPKTRTNPTTSSLGRTGGGWDKPTHEEKSQKLDFQVDAGHRIENMAHTAGEAKVQCCTVIQCSHFSTGHIHSGNNHNHIPAQSVDMQVDGIAHQRRHYDRFPHCRTVSPTVIFSFIYKLEAIL